MSTHQHIEHAEDLCSSRRPLWRRIRAVVRRTGVTAVVIGGGLAAVASPAQAAPTTNLTSGPSGTVTSTTATFQFNSAWVRSTFKCKLDSGAYASCVSPRTYSGLAAGTHTFSVYTISALGVPGAPVSRTWTIAGSTPPPPPPPPPATPPVTTILSGPTGTVTSTSASFSFNSSVWGGTFKCKLDSGSYATCVSPQSYSALAAGTHTFSVYTIDSTGLAGAPASQTWTVSVPPPPPPPSGGSLVWNGDLSTGNLSQGWSAQACSGANPITPQGATVVSSPVHPGWTHSIQLSVADTSITANCPILGSPGHPNAQIVSKPLFTPGMNVYIGVSVYIPPNFPVLCTPYVSGCFFSFMEVYGPPYVGSPPYALMGMGSHFALGTRAYADAWNSPNWTPGTWNDFVFHVNFATDNTGYVELWYNGVQQTLWNGSTRVYEPTLMSGVNWDGSTPDHLSLQQYRGAVPTYGTVNTYETGAKVGTSYAAVAP